MGSLHAGRTLGGAAVAVLALIVVQVALADTRPDPRKQPLVESSAADNASAKSSVIRFSDLVKGFRVDTKQGRTPVIPHCESYPGDRSDITVTGAASSSFMQASNSISSTALFFKTWADSDRYWQKTVRPKYVQCLDQVLGRGDHPARNHREVALRPDLLLDLLDRFQVNRLLAHQPSLPFVDRSRPA